MNDKVATLNTAPISTPAKDASVAAHIAQPIKAEDSKQPAEPALKPAIKS